MSQSSFREVWNSAVRRDVHNKIDFKRCPNPCQFDGHARLLSAIEKSKDVGHNGFL
jgi:hypothetical protein